MDWFWFGVIASMVPWALAGNILGTFGGRFTPPRRPVGDRVALTDRVAPQYVAAQRVTEPAAPVIVHVHIAAPVIPGWAPQPDVIDGQVVAELPQGAV